MAAYYARKNEQTHVCRRANTADEINPPRNVPGRTESP